MFSLANIAQWASSDGVTAMALIVGVPACVYLAGCTAMMWVSAARGVRLWHPLPMLAIAVGLAVDMLWLPVANQIALEAMLSASPGNAVSASDHAFIDMAVLWPTGWCLCLAVFSFGTTSVSGHHLRGLLVALTTGFSCAASAIVVMITFGVLVPELLRIPFFLVCVAADVAVLIIAWRDKQWTIP